MNDVEKKDFLKSIFKIHENKIPIKKGCPNPTGCYCTGICQEVIGYVDINHVNIHKGES